MLSVLIPTLPDRAGYLAQVTDGYRREVPGVEILTARVDSWGRGCNELAARAAGDVWLLAPDDMAPGPGFLRPGLEMLERGWTPAACCVDVNGQPLHPEFDLAEEGEPLVWTRLFLTTPARFAEVGPLLALTWFTDFDWSERLNAAGYEVRSCPGFRFTHLDAPRLWATEAEVERQRAAYHLAKQGAR